jgi:aminoglycoside 3-N-acetyltransferase
MIRWYYRVFRRFDSNDLLKVLELLDVRKGDTLLLHSKFSSLKGYAGGPEDLIAALKQAVGPQGTLAMMTIPFNGYAVDYALTDPVFDVLETPSLMGVLTETFRKDREVRRSLHPTHATAAWGKRAEELIADHHLAPTPCGPDTPIGRLVAWNAKVLSLGDTKAMTILHYAEESAKDMYPLPILTDEIFNLRCKDRDGRIVECSTRLYVKTEVTRNRPAVFAFLHREGLARSLMLGQCPLTTARSHDVMKAASHLMEAGNYWIPKPIERT